MMGVMRFGPAARAAALAMAGALGCAGPAAAATYSSLTVFGDSLVDAGNIADLTGGTQPNPQLGYKNGRFTNGYDYTDLLSQDLFGTVTQASRTGGSNYAYGNARVVANSDPVPDLLAQIAAFKARSGGVADKTGLYVFTIGSNDVFAALDGTYDTATYATPDAYLRATAMTYAQGIQSLVDMGAGTILFTNIAVPRGLAYSAETNGYLQADLTALGLGGADIRLADLAGTVTAAFTDPASLGLPPLNLATSCIAANAQASGCEGYFSFDGVHPTAQVQKAFYDSVVRPALGIGAVPETATWIEMLAGVSLVGVALRRRAGTAAA